jgi:hypothetical protein
MTNSLYIFKFNVVKPNFILTWQTYDDADAFGNADYRRFFSAFVFSNKSDDSLLEKTPTKAKYERVFIVLNEIFLKSAKICVAEHQRHQRAI